MIGPAAAALLDGLTFAYADRGYAGQPVIELVEASDAEVLIPQHQRAKQPRDDDRWWYQERHSVDCCISKIKQFRRVFSRFDKLAHRYLGFILFASFLVRLR